MRRRCGRLGDTRLGMRHRGHRVVLRGRLSVSRKSKERRSQEIAERAAPFSLLTIRQGHWLVFHILLEFPRNEGRIRVGDDFERFIRSDSSSQGAATNAEPRLVRGWI